MHPRQVEIFRAMSPEKKIQVVMRLHRTAWDLKAAGIREQHPD